MADKIVILEDENGNNIYPITRGLAADSVDTNAIQDGAVTSSKIDSATYTTTEKRVGTWIDGKTIYRKVITADFDSYLPSGTTTIPHNISGVSEIIGIDAMYQLGWDTSTYGDESYLAMNGFQVLAGSQNISIINVGQNTWSGTFKFTLKYTKTTD